PFTGTGTGLQARRRKKPAYHRRGRPAGRGIHLGNFDRCGDTFGGPACGWLVPRRARGRPPRRGWSWPVAPRAASRSPASGRWPKIVPIASLPKAGGTWLVELLAEVPGYASRPYRDVDGCTFEHDICAGVFESLPPDRLSLIKLHTRPLPQNVALFERLGLKA